jgi:hypothetical protein
VNSSKLLLNCHGAANLFSIDHKDKEKVTLPSASDFWLKGQTNEDGPGAAGELLRRNTSLQRPTPSNR